MLIPLNSFSTLVVNNQPHQFAMYGLGIK